MEVSEYYQEQNLIDSCTWVPVDWEAVLDDPEAIENCDKFGIDRSEIEDAVADNSDLGLNASDIYEADLYDYADWGLAYFDKYIFKDIVGDYIDLDANIYLVLGSGMTWRSLDGYKFADDIIDAMLPDYDCGIYLRTFDFDRKVLTYKETSHDVPMGASMTIIALTEEEYDAITYDGYDDPNPDMVDKLLTQGHLDPEDFESDDEDPEDEYGEW